jgi:hypothetical protein
MPGEKMLLPLLPPPLNVRLPHPSAEWQSSPYPRGYAERSARAAAQLKQGEACAHNLP